MKIKISTSNCEEVALKTKQIKIELCGFEQLSELKV
jgi:hypothetical protein